MSVKIKGLNELSNKLQKIQKAAQELDGTHEVKMSELFPMTFMQRYTQFVSFDELLEKSGFKVDTQEDFKAIPDDEFDAYICEVTRFDNWKAMLDMGTKEYVTKKLGF